MPQLNIYLDELTIKQVKASAKKQRLSLSKWAARCLVSASQNEWSDDFFACLGSITDTEFNRPEPLEAITDSPRESF
jgi:hypothetical protein